MLTLEINSKKEKKRVLSHTKIWTNFSRQSFSWFLLELWGGEGVLQGQQCHPRCHKSHPKYHNPQPQHLRRHLPPLLWLSLELVVKVHQNLQVTDSAEWLWILHLLYTNLEQVANSKIKIGSNHLPLTQGHKTINRE